MLRRAIRLLPLLLPFRRWPTPASERTGRRSCRGWGSLLPVALMLA